MNSARALLTTLIVVTGGAAASEGPRSVIPWLSESLSKDPWDDSLLPMFGDPNGDIAGTTPFGLEPITTTSLDDPVREGLGLLVPRDSGFPQDLWGNTSSLRVRSMLAAREPAGVPAARRLFHDILIAQTAPPPGSGVTNALLLARIDALLTAGYLDASAALLDRMDATDPEVFRRVFDVALLTDQEEAICARLRGSPALSPTLTARVFCLARGGDWDAAALTLQTGHDVGLISGEEEALLAAFLDPSLVEDATFTGPESPLTTLNFVLRDSIALPRASGKLPVAFEFLDAAEGNAQRTRMEAMERLVKEGVLAESALFEVYRAGKPASSGGIWDRAKVVQDLDDAFAIGATDGIARALRAADETLGLAGLRLAFAQAFRRQLAALDAAGFDPADQRVVFELLLLADNIEEARKWRADNGDATARFELALIHEGQAFPGTDALEPNRAAIASGLSAEGPTSETATEIAALFDGGRFGEGLLRTLDLLTAGPEADPQDLASALFLLRHAGLTDQARQIAIQSLYLLQEA